VRQEIPVLAKRLGLAGQDGLLHVLSALSRKGGVAGTDPLQVMAVRGAHLRKVKPARVQTVDFGGAGSSRHRRVESLDRVEVDLGRAVAHDAVEGPEADAAGEHREGMDGDRQAALLVDLADGPVQRAPHGNGLIDEERQQVAMQGRDLAAGNHIESILVGQLQCLVAARQPVVIGDGDHVQVGAIPDVVEHLSDGSRPIVQGRVHVEVGFAHEILLNRPQRPAPAVTEW